MEKIQRAAIYIRVSTSEQAMRGKSLPAQKESLERYAEEHGMTVVGIYADEGQTARKELKKRKAIHALLEDVKRGKIDIILFWKMDRWFRNVSDFYKVQDILDAHGVTWVAIAEPNINLETRDGRLQLNIMLSIGQNEVDTTSERIKFTVNNMIENGRLVWGEANMPLGYKIGIENGKKCMVKDPESAPQVEAFFKYYMEHQNKRETVRYMQETFGINFSYSKLRTMLQSEFYIGKYRGVDYCPAYLSMDDWLKIQTISKKNIKTTPSGRIYYFSGMIPCPLCGHMLTGIGCSMVINRKTEAKKTYCYYRCNKHILDFSCDYNHRLSQIMIEKYLLDNLQFEYEKFKRNQIGISEVEIKKNKQDIANLKRELTNLNMLFQKSRISWDYYDKEYQRINNLLASIKEPVNPSRNHTHTEGIIKGNFRAQYEQLTEKNKQAFWHSIIETIQINEASQVVGVIFT